MKTTFSCSIVGLLLGLTTVACHSTVDIERHSGGEGVCVDAGTWDVAAPMGSSRWLPQLVAVNGGRALAIGGRSGEDLTASIERYDATADAWAPIEGLAEPRQFHSATLLGDGRVLVAGGYTGALDGSGAGVTRVEIVDPTTGGVTETTPMPSGRYIHGAARLPSGAVLVTGGFTADVELSTALVFDPKSASWSTVPAPADAAGGYVAVASSARGAWVVGYHGVYAFDEATKTFALVDAPLPEGVDFLNVPTATPLDGGGIAVVDVSGYLGIGDASGAFRWSRIWELPADKPAPIVLGAAPTCDGVVIATDQGAWEVDVETGAKTSLDPDLDLGALTRLSNGALLSVGGVDSTTAAGSAAARVLR